MAAGDERLLPGPGGMRLRARLLALAIALVAVACQRGAGSEGPKNLVIIPGIGHYDIYRGAREQAHSLAQAWFDRHLR